MQRFLFSSCLRFDLASPHIAGRCQVVTSVYASALALNAGAGSSTKPITAFSRHLQIYKLLRTHNIFTLFNNCQESVRTKNKICKCIEVAGIGTIRESIILQQNNWCSFLPKKV